MFEGNVIALIGATIILVLIPGPNVALIVANSLRYGTRFGLVTVFGTTIGVALQLALVMAGLAELIESAAHALTWLRWLGVAYLIYLGMATWLQPASNLSTVRAQNGTAGTLFWHGLGLACLNPKTLLFNAAFVPQFVTDEANATGQLMLLGAVFVIVLGVGDSVWALSAGAVRPLIVRYGRLRSRLSGGFLLGAGVGLALSRRSF